MNNLLSSVVRDDFSYFSQNFKDIENLATFELCEIFILMKFKDKKYRDKIENSNPESMHLFDLNNSYYLPDITELSVQDMQHYKTNYPETYDWMVSAAFFEQIFRLPADKSQLSKIIKAIDTHQLGDTKKFEVYLHFNDIPNILEYITAANNICDIIYGESTNLNNFDVFKAMVDNFGWDSVMMHFHHLMLTSTAEMLHNFLTLAADNDTDANIMQDYPDKCAQYSIILEKKKLQAINCGTATKIQKI